MNSTIIIDNITSAKAHFGSVVECAKYLANKYVRESTTACAMTAIKYTSSAIHRIEPRLLCGTGTDSVVRDVCVNSHNSNTTLIMKPWPSSLLTRIKECTTQEIFTPSNVSACSRKITDHCCVSYCKISNCTEYLTEVWENFFANTVNSNEKTFDRQDSEVNYSMAFVVLGGAVSVTCVAGVLICLYKTKSKINNPDIKEVDTVVELSTIDALTVDNNLHKHIDENIYADIDEHVYETMKPKGDSMIQTLEVV